MNLALTGAAIAASGAALALLCLVVALGMAAFGDGIADQLTNTGEKP